MSKRKIELNRTGGVLAFTPGSHMRFMKNESDSLRAVAYKDPQCVFEEKPTAFSIGSMNSEGMKSDNPNAGFYETETGRTLDENGGNPAAYQGGIAVVYDARGNGNGEIAPTMTGDHQNRVTDYTAVVCEDKAQGFPLSFIERAGCSGGGKGILIREESTGTITSQQTNVLVPREPIPINTMVAPTMTGDHQTRVTDYTAVVCEDDSRLETYQQTTGTLSPGAHAGSYNGQDAYNDMLVAAVDCRNGTEDPNTNGTLQAKSNGGTSYNLNNVVRESVVRRLTPTECTRLMAFPDGWVDIGEWADEKGKKHKEADAPRYRALGNSIALPFWFWLLKRISAHCEEKTMGSLFDGIGGFPLCWQFINGDSSVRWSSEIEPFCIAVLKQHFGDEETGQKGDWETYVDRNENEA